jgi:hypothetical protein
MFPRWHILYGTIFSVLFWVLFPAIAWYNITLIVFGSIFIDFDHYMNAVLKTKKWSLFEAFAYHRKLRKKETEEKRKGIFRKGDFEIFHTIESHLFILALGLVLNPFLYVFIGMVFHSFIDLIDLANRGFLYRREFFLTNWIRRKIKAKMVHKIIFPKK